MKLFFYEARKTYIRKYIIIFLLLLTIIDIVKISLDYKAGNIDSLMAESQVNREAVNKMYRKVKNCTLEERHRFIANEEQRLGEIRNKHLNRNKPGEYTYSGNLYEDYRLLKMYIAKQYYYMNDYWEYSKNIELLAQENKDYYENLNNTCQKKVNEFIVQNYKNRSINEYCRMETMESYLNYNFSAVLIIIISLLAFSPVFGLEYESGMQSIIMTSKEKGRNLMIKLAGAMLFCFFIVCWFFIVDYLSFRYICGMEGFNMPIWSITGMKNSFLNCTIGYFIFIKYGAELLGFITIMLILLFLSAVLKKAVYIMLVFSPILFSSYYFSDMINSVSSIEKALSVCNPVSLVLSVRLYEKLYYLECGNGFILASNLCIYANAILSVVLIIAIIFTQRRKCLK